MHFVLFCLFKFFLTKELHIRDTKPKRDKNIMFSEVTWYALPTKIDDAPMIWYQNQSFFSSQKINQQIKDDLVKHKVYRTLKCEDVWSRVQICEVIDESRGAS